MTGTIRADAEIAVTEPNHSGSTDAARYGHVRWSLEASSFALAAGLCGVLAYYTTFNSFGVWDDEGAILLSLRAFVHHGGLYTHIYSAFGPFYYEAFTLVFRWLPVTLDNGRIVTVVMTLLAGVGFGVAVRMLAGSLLAGLATMVATTTLLSVSYANESMHPMILGWLLFSIGFVALGLYSQGKRTAGAVMLGATTSALLLTVVNNGAFALIALVFTGLILAPPNVSWDLPRALGSLLFVITPFLIVALGIHAMAAWALQYALIVALAAAGIVVVNSGRNVRGLLNRRDIYWFLVSGCTLVLVVLLIAIATGTGPVDLVRSMFLDTARYSNIITVPLPVSGGNDIGGAACLAAAFAYRRFLSHRERASFVDGGLRVIVGLAFLYAAIAATQILGQIPSGLPFHLKFTAVLPLVFVAATPTPGMTGPGRVARIALACFVALEAMTAYPVAGPPQIIWSALLMVPLGMLCLHDGIQTLRSRMTAEPQFTRIRPYPRVMPLAFLVCLGLTLWVLANDLAFESARYIEATPVRLSGSDLMRMPARQAANFEEVTKSLNANCSTFIAMPVMNSFYFWTGTNPPHDWFNTWFDTQDVGVQNQVVREVEGRPNLRFCVLTNLQLSRYWFGTPLPKMPLVRFVRTISRDDGPPREFGTYHLFMSRG